jgi:DNA-binding NarL/FixJ family response regulator
MELARTRASLKVGLQRDVMARVAAGMSVREIARALNQRPAVVSRHIEQAKAAERKKQKNRTHAEMRHRS